MKVPWGADLSALKSLDFRIEKTPQVTLGADATSFDATGGVIVATARGTSRGGGEGAFSTAPTTGRCVARCRSTVRSPSSSPMR